MISKRSMAGIAVLAIGTTALWLANAFAAQGQPMPYGSPTAKEGSHSVAGQHQSAHTPQLAKEAPHAPKEVTIKGKIVDLNGFMTGQYASTDHAKSAADSIKAGIPAVLETPTGIVLLGQGMKGMAEKLVPLAYQEVEAKGKLYEKHGVRYVEIASVEKVPSMAETPKSMK